MASRKLKTTPAVTFMKVLLVIFTIVLLIIGACLFGAGIYSKVELGNYGLLTSMNGYQSAPYVMIGIGVFLILTGIFGFFAIAKGNTCMLRTYGVVLGILFLAELVFAIVVAVYKGTIRTGFEEGTTTAITQYSTNKELSGALNKTQSMLDCCGSTNYTDYWLKGNFTNLTVPESCCISKQSCQNVTENGLVSLPSTRNASDFINEIGCPAKVFDTVDDNLAAILGSMFGVAVFQLIGLILSCCLASSINANKYELV